jgi:hypothetical protein
MKSRVRQTDAQRPGFAAVLVFIIYPPRTTAQ